MFRLRINTSNAAFDINKPHELARMLRAVADTIDQRGLYADDKTEGKVYDYNGNNVGQWSHTVGEV